MNTTIQEAVDEAADRWMNLPGVQGVAQGERAGKECILVYVKTPEAPQEIPARYKGWPVVIEMGDAFFAQEP